MIHHPVIKARRRRTLPNYVRQGQQQLWVDDLETPTRWDLVSFKSRYHPPYGGQQAVTGQYIGPYMISPFTEAPGDKIKPVNLRLYYVPIQIPYEMRIVELSIDITTSFSDKQAKLGIYAFERGKVTEFIYKNTIAVNTTGVRTVGANVILAPGTYMFAFISDADSNTLKIAATLANNPILGYDRNDGYVPYTMYYEDKDDFDDDWDDNPTVILTTGQSPHVYAKVG